MAAITKQQHERLRKIEKTVIKYVKARDFLASKAFHNATGKVLSNAFASADMAYKELVKLCQQ